MDRSWRERELAELSRWLQNGAPAGSALSKWREGFAPVFREQAGADLGTLYVVDLRPSSPWRGALLNLHWGDPEAVSRERVPLQVFEALRTLEECGSLVRSTETDPYLESKAAALARRLIWDRVEAW